MSELERLASRREYQGRIASVRVDTFRYADGSESEREIVEHPGAVAVVAHDGRSLFLVRQPREAVGEPALLELPAGKLDVEGESPLETARRELVEEIGKRADHWREIKRFYTSPGFAAEEVWIYLATGLSDVDFEPDAEERIEVVEAPLAELPRLIEGCRDAKTLIGLALLREELRAASR